MTTERAIDTLAFAIRNDPLALIACCTVQLIHIRKWEPELMPDALRMFAAITKAIAGQKGAGE